MKIDKIKVVGIDPAPSKKTTIFDGNEFKAIPFNKLKTYLEELKQNETKVLICWDAPLSFCSEGKSPFYKRPIESFFSKKEYCKSPKGISVLGYGACPHWAISQYMLGYPKIGNYDTFSPPFKLVFDKNSITKSLTEVHPALAIWLWTKNSRRINSWDYKINSKTFNTILDLLLEKQILTNEIKSKIENSDDKLDAYIAWKLGVYWIDNNNNVNILGNNKMGSFLLPISEKLKNKFDKFQVNTLL